MSPDAAQHLRDEAHFIQQSAALYRQTFTQLVEELNRPHDSAAERRGVRLCVEAINLLLDSQDRLARTLLVAVAPPIQMKAA